MKMPSKRYERKLIKEGTAVGPVTQDMIDRCKAIYPNHPSWEDFLPKIRLEMSKEIGYPITWPGREEWLLKER